jgi:hypothetical protein
MQTKNLEEVRCQVRCSLGWLAVTFHIPAGQSLDDYLTHAPPFVPTTDATLLRTGRVYEFLDLQLDGVSMVSPLEGLDPAAGASADTDVVVIMPTGTLEGRLALRAGARVSDHFAHRRGFFPLHHSVLYPFDRADAAPGPPDPRLVYMNSRLITGVAEGRRPPASS